MVEPDNETQMFSDSFSISNEIYEEQIIQDENNEGENSLINEIDNNNYIVHEEETEPTHVFDESVCYNIIGKTFANPDLAFQFYNEYGLSKGFGIRKHLLDRKKTTNEIYRRIFVCNKQGYKNMKDKRRSNDDIKRRSITRTGCTAMIQVTLSKQEEWVVDKFYDEHNHPLDPPSQVLKQRSHSIFHRSNECKDTVTLLSKAGMTPSQITKVVNAFRFNENDKLTRVQCSAIVGSERRINLGKECHGIVMHFQQKSELEKDFYFAIDLCTDGTLRNVFWADGRSRSDYCRFGDVVVFDVTYKTNSFSLPFSPIVGVNHHAQSILFGAALLENETETTFTWLFKQFLQCMHDCPPVSIITDQDLAMGKAIAKVFPKTRHRYCAWHIQRHVLEHLQPLRIRYDDFKDTYNRWVKSNIEDFESGWETLKQKYQIGDDTWLGNMFKLHRYWIKTYLKDTFFAGMTTSGRSESIHSFFDGFVNSKTMLNEFVVQYDKAVSSRRGAEEDQDFRTINSKPTLHSDHPIEVMAAECYTRNVYDIFKKEWRMSFDCGHETLKKDSCLVKYRVGFLKGNIENWKIVEFKVTSEGLANCSCAKFETYGILCKHILYIMRKKSIKKIPNHYIIPRWTMKAMYKVGSIRTTHGGTNDYASREVDFLTLWSVRTKFNRLLEDAKESPNEIERVDIFLDGLLEEQNTRKKAKIEVNTEKNSTVPSTTQKDILQHLLVSDPVNPVKTKGRPKNSTRIKFGIEMAMESKKKNACGYCKEKGHNTTRCQKRKMEEAKKMLIESTVDLDDD